MSIASQISRIAGNVSAALAAIAAKGVTVPSGSDSDDLATLIGQISGGGGAGGIVITDTADSHGGIVREITAVEISGTKQITQNGTGIDVTSYAAVDVNVSGTAAKTKTGTFTGTGSITVSITDVDFEPDLIFIYGDLTGSSSYRGVSTLVIIRDTIVLQTNDASQSSTSESLQASEHGISGLNESSTTVTHATYSGTTLTVTTVSNTTANRFNSSITYNYKLIKWTA